MQLVSPAGPTVRSIFSLMSTSAPKPRTIACPQCGTAVVWTPASQWRPFCSERCKLIDFGSWASESYRVPAADAPDTDDEDAAPPVDRARERR